MDLSKVGPQVFFILFLRFWLDNPNRDCKFHYLWNPHFKYREKKKKKQNYVKREFTVVSMPSIIYGPYELQSIWSKSDRDGGQ